MNKVLKYVMFALISAGLVFIVACNSTSALRQILLLQIQKLAKEKATHKKKNVLNATLQLATSTQEVLTKMWTALSATTLNQNTWKAHFQKTDLLFIWNGKLVVSAMTHKCILS